MATPAAIETISEIAQDQDGFLTAAQAADRGVDGTALSRMVKQRLLERDERGLYRLLPYPISERAELWRAVLAPGVQRSDGLAAVLCDGTALGLYEVSTINPSRIEVAIPRAARLRRELPKGLVIERRDYPPEDVTRMNGLPVTTLFRTLVDLIRERKDLQFVDEALVEAPKRGLLTTSEAQSLSHLRALTPKMISYLLER